MFRVRSASIERKKCSKPWKVLCLGLFVLGCGTLRAQTPAAETQAETRLLNAAKVYFGNDIKPSEEKLFRKAANGLEADFTTGTPDDDSPKNTAAWKDDRVIRANRLAWLLLDPLASSQVSPRGVLIKGAQIKGKLDLSAAKISFPISIAYSYFTDVTDVRRASLRLLDLEGSYTKGLSGDGLNVERDLFLRSGFKSEGEVWLRAATIGGSLECTGSQFLNSDGFALFAEGAKIGGSVFMNQGFRAEGGVSLLNATITGSFECYGGAFINEKGSALISENVTFGGHLHCGNGFTSIGEVDFMGATIRGVADFSAGSFTNKNQNGWAINGDSMTVENVILGPGFKSDGVVWLRAAHITGSLDVWGADFSNPHNLALNLTYAKIGSLHFYQRAKINGAISLMEATIDTSLCWEDLEQPGLTTWDLRNTKVKTLAVQRKSWPAPGHLRIFGLVFDELAEPAAPLANAQLSWIQLQTSGRFTTQPFDQLAAVFRNMGLQEEATKVMIAKNNEHGHHSHGFKEYLWYNLFGPFINFGYDPWNAFYLSIAIIILGFFLFRAGYRSKIVTPTSKDAYENSDVPGGNLTELYPRFNAFIYSLETFVPLLALDMDKYWRPNPNRKENMKIGSFTLPINGSRLTYYLWFHVTIGWILTTLWFGGLTGLLKP
ncbi:MAG: hypothetical protein WB696_00600 [Chthoniobacterales bacterium]|jgi:hypothetical protein